VQWENGELSMLLRRGFTLLAVKMDRESAIIREGDGDVRCIYDTKVAAEESKPDGALVIPVWSIDFEELENSVVVAWSYSVHAT